MHDFFDDKNQEGMAIRLRSGKFNTYATNHSTTTTTTTTHTHTQRRRHTARLAMNDMKQFLQAGKELGRVAIYDATNTTRERRAWIVKELLPLLDKKSQVIFVESICDDDSMVERNIKRVKITMPDYKGVDGDTILSDFKQRIQHYVDVYEPLDTIKDKELSWIKIRDAGQNIHLNRISGYLAGRITKYLMNLHLVDRPIYLSRHGRSKYNELGKIGGDSPLGEEGKRYSVLLGKFCDEVLLKQNPRTRLWTSSLRRTKETAQHIPHRIMKDGWVTMRHRVWKSLDELFAGTFDGMTYEEIEKKAPGEFARRKADKLNYRYPRGESYLDVITRLEPVVLELERQEDPVLIVAHQGIHRMLYAYFTGMSRDQAPFVSIPLNNVIKLQPGAYTCEEERIVLIPPHKDKCVSDPPSH